MLGELKVTTVEALDQLVRHMHDNQYCHSKRGYQLDEATPAMAGIHLVEEVTEYVAACIAPDGMKKADRERPRYAYLIEESGDALACLLHLNYMMGIPLAEVVQRAFTKLDEVFSLPSD